TGSSSTPSSPAGGGDSRRSSPRSSGRGPERPYSPGRPGNASAPPPCPRTFPHDSGRTFTPWPAATGGRRRHTGQERGSGERLRWGWLASEPGSVGLAWRFEPAEQRGDVVGEPAGVGVVTAHHLRHGQEHRPADHDEQGFVHGLVGL